MRAALDSVMSHQLRLQVFGTLAFAHVTEVPDERADAVDERLVVRPASFRLDVPAQTLCVLCDSN
jgi:hypothetical protein